MRADGIGESGARIAGKDLDRIHSSSLSSSSSVLGGKDSNLR
jgi:hypothetical protein